MLSEAQKHCLVQAAEPDEFGQVKQFWFDNRLTPREVKECEEKGWMEVVNASFYERGYSITEAGRAAIEAQKTPREGGV